VLARYQIVRGRRDSRAPLPTGTREDTRKHTRHPLRPSAELVTALFADPSERGFLAFRMGYLALLSARFESERKSFDQLAERAHRGAVYIGCNCPTARQPDVSRCHTFLALEFMARAYPELDVVRPARGFGRRT
jgi:hypothetical protein